MSFSRIHPFTSGTAEYPSSVKSPALSRLEIVCLGMRQSLPAGRSAQTGPATATGAGLKLYLQRDVKSALAFYMVTLDGWAWKPCRSCTGLEGCCIGHGHCILHTAGSHSQPWNTLLKCQPPNGKPSASD